MYCLRCYYVRCYIYDDLKSKMSLANAEARAHITGRISSGVHVTPSSLANRDGLNNDDDDGCSCSAALDGGFGANPENPLKTPAPPFGGGGFFV